MKKNNDITVFISSRDSTCEECGETLGHNAWITLEQEKGAVCLSCADLDKLVFLPSGDAALTRRSKKYSTLSAVVLKWSKRRKRYERQGLLVEEQALNQAETECLADSDARARQRARAAERRAELDEQYIKKFAERVRQLYPGCPVKREQAIAKHACLKYSGRIGRTGSAKKIDKKTIELAVIAHIRHLETTYDQLLAKGHDRQEARAMVQNEVVRVLNKWQMIIE